MGEIRSPAHSRWRCECHIVFAPKYRRKEIYGKLKEDIGQILRKLCKEKKVDILEAEACADPFRVCANRQFTGGFNYNGKRTSALPISSINKALSDSDSCFPSAEQVVDGLTKAFRKT